MTEWIHWGYMTNLLVFGYAQSNVLYEHILTLVLVKLQFT